LTSSVEVSLPTVAKTGRRGSLAGRLPNFQNQISQEQVSMKVRSLCLIGLLMVGTLFAASGTALAAKKKKKGAKPNAVNAALVKKYDTNNDGKLSKAEKAAMPKADLAKLGGKKKKKK
jgi:hypothetical protein